MQWSDQDMVAAISAVCDRKLSITQAAQSFNVPRKTLDDRIKNKVVHGTHPGPSTVLTSKEEDAFVSYLLYMAQHDYPLTRTLTKVLAWAIAVRSGKDGCFGKEGPSEHWWTGFRQHHPELTLRKTDNLERSRADALTPEVIKQYFDLLNDVLEKHKLKNSPRQIITVMRHLFHLTSLERRLLFIRRVRTHTCRCKEHPITSLCCVLHQQLAYLYPQ